MTVVEIKDTVNVIKEASDAIFGFESLPNSNPNGDPASGQLNKPRMRGNINWVSDDRIKRTTRDFATLLGQDIFYRPRYDKDGNLKDIKEVTKEYTDYQDLIDKSFDLRCFGCGPIKFPNLGTLNLRGPIQVRDANSLHPVKMIPDKGTSSSFATTYEEKGKKTRGAMTTKYVVDYSFLAGSININPYVAKTTGLTEKDLQIFYQSLWEGTNYLKTSTKNQRALLLINVVYSRPNFCLTELSDYLELIPNEGINIADVKNTKDFELDLNPLKEYLETFSKQIKHIDITFDKRLKFNQGLEETFANGFEIDSHKYDGDWMIAE